MRMRMLVYFYCLVLCCWYWCPTADALAGLSSRAFRPPPDSTTSSTTPTISSSPPPKLILIGGCSGTRKSTFGMSVALDQGILKCISTDTLRSVMRSFVTAQVSPALHRSSYAPPVLTTTTTNNREEEKEEERIDDDDPVETWKQTCTVLQHSVEELVEEMMHRRVSVVIEGVHLIPDNTLIERWEANGGVAVGVVLMVPDEEAHKSLLVRRGQQTGKTENKKLAHFSRIRAIHDELVRLAKVHNWQLIEQNLQPDPLEVVASRLWTSGGTKADLATTDEGRSSDEVSSYLSTAVNASSTAEELT